MTAQISVAVSVAGQGGGVWLKEIYLSVLAIKTRTPTIFKWGKDTFTPGHR